MSKHQTLVRLLIDINTMSHEELAELYGVSFEGEVLYDPVLMRSFDDLRDWAHATADEEEADNYGTFQKVSGKHRFDDD